MMLDYGVVLKRENATFAAEFDLEKIKKLRD